MDAFQFAAHYPVVRYGSIAGIAVKLTGHPVIHIFQIQFHRDGFCHSQQRSNGRFIAIAIA